MTITLTTEPTYALPGAVRVRVAANGVGANFVRLWLTDAPLGSKLRRDLDKAGHNVQRLQALEIDAGDVATLDLETGGAYVFTGQEYTKGASSHGGGYEGSPDANPSETKVGAEQTGLKVYVGERLAHPLGCASHGRAVLLCWVWNDTIRETTVAIHGERTPAIVNPTTQLATLAAHSSSVVPEVGNMIGKTAAGLTSGLQTLFAEMRIDIADHMQNRDNGGTAFHSPADGDNNGAIERLPADPGTPAGYAAAVAVLVQRLRQHMNNKDGVAAYHDQPDFTNALICDVPSPTGDAASTYAALADVFRAFEAHRVLAGSVHDAADTGNPLTTTLPPLVKLHKEFLAAMQPFAPTVPASMQPAVIHMGALGFKLVRP